MAKSAKRVNRKKTPMFVQQEDADCGAACLGIVLAHFGRWESLEQLRDACGTGRDGCSAKDILSAARQYGLEIKGFRMEPEQLTALEPPLILFWEFNHFLVLEGIGRGAYRLNDPASGRRKVDDSEFDKAFTGVVLTVKPGANFKTGGNAPSILGQLWPWMRGHKFALSLAALWTFLLVVPGFGLPILLSIFIDNVLTGDGNEWAVFVIGASAIAGLATYALTWLQTSTLRRLGVRLAVEQADRHLTRLFNLPLQFFMRRQAGDLLERVRLIDSVATVGTTQFVALGVEALMSMAFLALMFYFDPTSAMAVALLGMLALLLVRHVVKLQKDHGLRFMREKGKLAGIGASGLLYLDHYKATATEDSFFSRWSGHQALELEQRQRFSELGHVTAALPDLLMIVGAAVVFGIAGLRTMNGDMTLGTLAGFYVVAGNFLRPICNIAQFSDMLQALEAQIQRLNDVMEAPLTAGFQSESKAAEQLSGPVTLKGRIRLSGKVELQEVSFGYQLNRPPLLKDFSMTIGPGQRVAVVGPSSSGKSTLAHLVSGAYEPWSGKILFDGVPRREIPNALLHESIAMVGQQPCLFAASIRENLTMWNAAVPEERMVAAARDAMIHEEILDRPGGYESLVAEGGTNFSGGQRQRLEIARALVNDPVFLVLDEATSDLDTLNEQAIDDALRRRGCSCLIVAHRLSTIRDSDLIIVLNDGALVQSGTHPELMAEGGIYREFLRNAE